MMLRKRVCEKCEEKIFEAIELNSELAGAEIDSDWN